MARQPAFDSKHPLWDEFIKLRQQGTYVYKLVALAAERGYPLSYRQINRGLASARYVKHLPARSSHWLQNKVAEIDAKINALDTMHGIAALSAEKLLQVQAQLDDPDLTYSRKTYLEKLEAFERKTLWGFCRDIVEIEIELGVREKTKPQDNSSVGIMPGSLQDHIRVLENEIVGALSGGKVRIREIEIEPGQSVKADLHEVVDPNFLLAERGFTRAPGEVIVIDGVEQETPPDEQEIV